MRLAAPERAAASAVFAAIRAVVREIDPALPVLNLRTQDEQIDRLHAQELLFARLSGVFGAVALALACVGLYGLMSHAVRPTHWRDWAAHGARRTTGTTCCG